MKKPKDERIITFKKKDLDIIRKEYLNGNITKARKYLEEYRKNYTDKHYVFKYHEAVILGYEGKMQEAIEKLYNLVNYYNQKEVSQAYYYLACLLTKEKRYKEAYEICKRVDSKEIIISTKTLYQNIKRCLELLEKELSIEKGIKDKDSYYKIQLYFYSNYYALKHIIKKHKENDEHCNFYIEEEKIEKLYNLINNALCISQKTIDYQMGDIYYYNIPEIGININTGEKTDTLKVITIPEKKEILTMYPVKKDKNSEWIINEIKEEKEYTNKKPKTRKSQIEKFNNKYKSS